MTALLMLTDTDAAGSVSSTCRDVARPLVAAVPQDGRNDAERLLGSSDLVPLTEDQAGKLLGVPVGRHALAGAVLGRAISRLQRERDAALEHGAGSWGPTDADELADLVRLEIRDILSPPTPFLFRAVRGFEGTGFSATECGDTLEIHHSSLGHSTPPPTKTTVIVFLHQKPAQVRSSYSVIE